MYIQACPLPRKSLQRIKRERKKGKKRERKREQDQRDLAIEVL